MNRKKIVATLMIICGLAEIPFSWLFLNNAIMSQEFPNAGYGTFMAMILNLLMVILGIVILVLKDKAARITRICAILLCVAVIVEICLSVLYALFTSIPLLILLPAYIFWASK